MEKSKFLVDGEWRSSLKTRSVINPFDQRTVGEVWQATSQDIDEAIGSAVRAFQQTRRLQAHHRSRVLSFIASQIEQKKETFAQLMTAETGKPVVFSRAEVDRSIFTFTYAAEEAKRLGGSVLPLDLAPHSDNRFAVARRFPIGPIAAITPFNFPLNLIAHKVAPAIAVGNTVVLKPSSSAPLTALLLADIIAASPLPQGSFNVVPCAAGEAGQLITDERIKMLSFTGSPEVGWGIKRKAGKKKVVLELGGNAGVVVDRDANLDYAVKRIVQGSYGNAGQSCIAVQRIYVHEALYEEFENRFVDASKALYVGDPSDEHTIVGPMIDEAAARKVEQWVHEAASGGAQILCGGKRKGAILEPTILVNVKPEMSVSCREVFAPVVTLDRFSDFREAVKAVNRSVFGLQAGVFTNDVNNVFVAYSELEVGGVIVNDYPTYRIDHMPYGGVKDSGFGREGIAYAMEEMSELKLLAFNFV
jgi:acyl-CoA reductase-like NAD-dependent aldehyde dehydrogenase